jgi:hypothetical protein
MKNKNLLFLILVAAGACDVNSDCMLQDETKDNNPNCSVSYCMTEKQLTDCRLKNKALSDSQILAGNKIVLRNDIFKIMETAKKNLFSKNLEINLKNLPDYKKSNRRAAAVILLRQLNDDEYKNIVKNISYANGVTNLIIEKQYLGIEKEMDDLTKKTNELFDSSLKKDRNKAYSAVQEMLAKEAGIKLEKKSWYQELQEKASSTAFSKAFSWSSTFAYYWGMIFDCKKYQEINNLQKKYREINDLQKRLAASENSRKEQADLKEKKQTFANPWSKEEQRRLSELEEAEKKRFTDLLESLKISDNVTH